MFPQDFDDGPGAERRKGHGENMGHWAMYILTWNGCDLNKDNFAIIVWELYPSSDFLTLDNLFEGTTLNLPLYLYQFAGAAIKSTTV